MLCFICCLLLKTKDSLRLLELDQASLVFRKKQLHQSYENSILPNNRDDIERVRKPFRTESKEVDLFLPTFRKHRAAAKAKMQNDTQTRSSERLNRFQCCGR